MSATQRTARAVEQFCDNRLFAGVDAEVIERITPKISVIKKKPGEVIFREGQPGDSLYLVAKGRIKIAKAADGANQEILDFVSPGNFFGATSLLAGEPHSTTATAVESAVIGEVGEETFQEILELSPARLHMNFLRAVTSRIRSANAHFMCETLRAERLRVAGALANAMIHDLKNPVCIARCCSDLIATESANGHLRELSAMLTDTVNGILGMTLDLLDYTRGSISVNKRPVSIWRLLDELNRQSLHLLPSKDIEFIKHIRYQGNIDIDLSRFARAFGIVIENSIQAMGRGGALTFTADLIEDQVAVRISDTGSGILPEVLSMLFEPFERHDGVRMRGVGLAVAKSIIDAHGGRISIRSVVGKGTTVDIRLPKPIEP
ncbi:MAG TPA: cyclic nucleotide-binding domain-containing protein [Chthoniobacterales bacterium]|jgi:signal transduction histidine kinase|nr:cyclic nucleotide-binding domain-containing protein [Chthoniobacterales bacterium]